MAAVYFKCNDELLQRFDATIALRGKNRSVALQEIMRESINDFLEQNPGIKL